MKPILLTFVSVVFLAAAAIGFQNCSKTEDEASGAPSARLYYWIQSNYTCTPMTGGAPIATWRGKIAVHSGQFFVHGDGCNDSIQAFPAGTSAFVMSADQNIVTYQGETYEYRATEPTF